MGLTNYRQFVRAKNITDYREKRAKTPTGDRNILTTDMVRRFWDVCIQKEHHFDFVSSSGKCLNHLLVGSISPDVTILIRNWPFLY